MKRAIFVLAGVVLAAVTLLAGTGGDHAVVAQGSDSDRPRAIVFFLSDRLTLEMADVESGRAQVTLSWEVAHAREGDMLALEQQQAGGWVDALPALDRALPMVNSVLVPVAPPQDFTPPTYRLLLRDAQGALVDEAYLSLPYGEPSTDAEVEIVSFTSAVQSLNLEAVASGGVTVQVAWEVENRQPRQNLVFEQVVAGGEGALDAELPRSNLWIPSSGDGPLAVVLPSGRDPLMFRLRVVDLFSGETKAESTITLQLTGTLPPSATPTFTPPPVQPSEARIESFTASSTDVAPSGSVTFDWQVTGAESVEVWRLSPEGELAEQAPTTALDGTWTLRVFESYGNEVEFVLIATDAAGREVRQTLTINVSVCPFEYFFEGGEGCAIREPEEISAAYQPFERGLMLWRGDTEEIYVLYDSGQRVEVHVDRWDEEPVEFDAPPPSSDVQQPVRGFGYLWVNNADIRTGLGWATAPEEAYRMTFQPSFDGSVYLTLPDDRIVRIQGASWETVAAEVSAPES
jgi:hypothetical protein